MKKETRRRQILLQFACLILALFALAACSKADKRKGGLEGSYQNNEMGFNVGYIFGADGFGYQLIGSEVYQIRYEIQGDSIMIENFSVEGGSQQTFDFYKGENYIRIGQIKFTKIEPAADNSQRADASAGAQR